MLISKKRVLFKDITDHLSFNLEISLLQALLALLLSCKFSSDLFFGNIIKIRERFYLLLR